MFVFHHNRRKNASLTKTTGSAKACVKKGQFCLTMLTLYEHKRVCVMFLHRHKTGNMTILGHNGRNRIAAPTDGHEWHTSPPKKNRLNPISDVSR